MSEPDDLLRRLRARAYGPSLTSSIGGVAWASANMAVRDADIADAIARIEELDGKIATLKAGLDAVDGLIADSAGVVGLHRNGEVAPWEELRKGGAYDLWLLPFDVALAEVSPPKKEHGQ